MKIKLNKEELLGYIRNSFVSKLGYNTEVTSENSASKLEIRFFDIHGEDYPDIGGVEIEILETSKPIPRIEVTHV